MMGFLPPNWSLKNAEDDFSKSDLIVIVRVVGLQLADEGVMKERGLQDKWQDTIYRGYTSELLILDVLREDSNKDLKLQTGSRFRMGVGGELSENSKNILMVDPASPALTMNNSQNGYDLRIGQTYLLCLSRNGVRDYPFDLRSGPFSIYWLQPGNKYKRKDLNDYGPLIDGADILIKSAKDAFVKSVQQGDAPEPASPAR